MLQERKRLERVDSLDLLDYVKQSVEILMHMREDEFLNFKKNWQLNEQVREKRLKQEKDKLKDIRDLKVGFNLDRPKTYRTPKNSRFFAKLR